LTCTLLFPPRKVSTSTHSGSIHSPSTTSRTMMVPSSTESYSIAPSELLHTRERVTPSSSSASDVQNSNRSLSVSFSVSTMGMVRKVWPAICTLM